MRLAAVVTALLLVSSPLLIKADSLTTFQIETASPDLSGTISLYPSTGTLAPSDVFVTVDGTTQVLTNPFGVNAGSSGYALEWGTATDYFYLYIVPTSFDSIVGYNGGGFYFQDGAGFLPTITGNLVPEAPPATTPEPPGLLLVASGLLLGFANFSYRSRTRAPQPLS